MTETGRVLGPGFEKASIYGRDRPFRLDPDIYNFLRPSKNKQSMHIRFH